MTTAVSCAKSMVETHRHHAAFADGDPMITPLLHDELDLLNGERIDWSAIATPATRGDLEVIARRIQVLTRGTNCFEEPDRFAFDWIYLRLVAHPLPERIALAMWLPGVRLTEEEIVRAAAKSKSEHWKTDMARLLAELTRRTMLEQASTCPAPSPQFFGL